jgi:hypothetical protein
MSDFRTFPRSGINVSHGITIGGVTIERGQTFENLAPSESPAVGLPSSPTTNPNVGVAQATASGQVDKPTPLSRWYATVTALVTGAATIELQDDSQGRSTITVPHEIAAPSVDERVIVDFRPDGLAAITAVVV